MIKKSLPLAKVYQLIEPGPVVMVTTVNKGKPNIMTMSWHMMIDFEPPILAIVMSDRNFSFKALKEHKECVINIPTADLAQKVVGVGNCSGRRVNKFKKFCFTPMPATQVDAPLIAECYANLECRVIDTHMAQKYNIFILEVVKAWITPTKKRVRFLHHWGNGIFTIDGKTITIASHKK